jgi:hypothetical protein
MNTHSTEKYAVPAVDDSHEIAVSANRETFTGTVTRVDMYGETTDVERVINYTITFKHQIDGDAWVPWKAYLVEEPAGAYRLNVVESDGHRSRTINHGRPTAVSVE